MEYSRKQFEVLRHALTNDDWRIIVNHGAVRSGKTIADNDIFLHELRKAKAKADIDGKLPMYILSGHSLGALKKNVIAEIESKYGLTIRLDEHNTFKMLGVRVCCFGHGNSDSYKSMVGMEAYGAYHNEMTTAHKAFIDEAQKRCSGRLRIIGDTNPDHPEHYVKKDYIDRADGKTIVEYSWKLTDNPFLDSEYVDGIKKLTPSGMFYERKVNGLWVTGDGVVYQDFDLNKHYLQKGPTNIKNYFAGVDWGYEHMGVIQLWCETTDGAYVMLREIAAQHQEIDYWVDIAKMIQSEIGVKCPFFCDSARPEHVSRFIREGIRATYARKEVMIGIETVAKHIKTDKLFIVEPNAHNFKSEIYSYSWDKKTGMPVKQNDNSMDTMRYAIYSHIATRIR